MRCPICGEELVEYINGIDVGQKGCEHYLPAGDIYPDLWSDEDREELDEATRTGEVLLETRSQGGYWIWFRRDGE